MQLVAAESTAPTPNSLLAALVDTRGASESDAAPSPLTGLAAALGLGLALWDTTVSVGASVVAGAALAPGLIGVGLNTAVVDAFLTHIDALVASGVIPAPVATGIAATVGGISTAVGIGVAGVGTAIAWKAALDAALANAIAPAGIDIINALLADFPNIDFAAAVAALVGGLAAMGETALTWWDATITLGASTAAGIGITAATSVVGLHTALTGLLLESLQILTGSGLLPASAAAALAELVESVSSATNAHILGIGSAAAWTAALPAALAHAIATKGLDLVEGIAGHFPGVPDYPVIDLAALRMQLEENFPALRLLPPLDFADLKPAKFLALLEEVFPNFPGVELPEPGSEHIDLAALIALLHGVFPKFPDPGDTFEQDATARLALLQGGTPGIPDSPDLEVSGHTEDEEPGSAQETNVVETTPPMSSTQVRDWVDSPKDVLPELAGSAKPALPDPPDADMPQPLGQEFAEELKNELPSASKHARPDEPDERSLIANASSKPPRHAFENTRTHELAAASVPDRKRSNSQSPQSRSSNFSHESDSSQRGTAATSPEARDTTSSPNGEADSSA